jgi:hypothetical protein
MRFSMRSTTRKSPKASMRASNPPLLVVRTGALGTIAGGLLFAVWGYLHQDNAPLYFNTIAHILAAIVPVLFLVGLATLWIRCAPRASRLVHPGIIVAFIGSTLGVIRSLLDIAVPSFYPHNALSGRALIVLDVWTLTLFVGLLLVGLALVGSTSLRVVGSLVLAMGSFGLAYGLTDSGAIFEARLVHVGLGALFSLGWVAVGVALWKKERSQPQDHASEAKIARAPRRSSGRTGA